MEQLTIETETGLITTYYTVNSDGSAYSIDLGRYFYSLNDLSEYIASHPELIAED